MLKKVIVCTATEDRYSEMALELIASIRGFPESEILDIGVIDLGLSPDRRAQLAAACDELREGRWDIPFSARRRRGRDWLIGRICKLFLPDYFPGYETYIWIDADAWLADWSAIDLLLQGSAHGAMAGVPDDWRTERIDGVLTLWHRWLPPIFRTVSYKHARRGGLSGAELRRLFNCKEFNGGVFAMRGDAPHWPRIQEHMRRLVTGRGRVFGSNQLALIMAVYLDGLPAEVLPYECNFVGWPMACAKTGRLVSPYLPHRPIGIMHLAYRTAQRDNRDLEDDLGTTDGGTLRRTIRYRPEDTAAALAVRRGHAAASGPAR